MMGCSTQVSTFTRTFPSSTKPSSRYAAPDGAFWSGVHDTTR
jgi:hypothetical protein